ncbi:unnamed protein product [Oikopleura dioica]|uniref:Uncharacterized protein n=1 Tax=Oikopleura dioica TaxID=34765 RepID=E4Y6F1_OIKDI|nr:unnamed protein product [Oikopleura dioica]
MSSTVIDKSIPRELLDLRDCLNKYLLKDEIAVNREMVQKAYNATNKMIQLFKEKWEMEDLEYQQKCQIESLRKQHRQVAEIRNGLQGTRATNERTIKSTDYDLDEAIEYGECLDNKITRLTKTTNELNDIKNTKQAKYDAEIAEVTAEKQQIEDELNADVSVKTAENDKYKKAISAAKNSVGGLTSALTACKNTLESAM